MAEPKLAEIAERIAAHLKRMEADPQINAVNEKTRTKRFFMANAWAAGRYVAIRTVSYQGEEFTAKGRARDYLAWLDAGNNGTYWAFRAATDNAARLVLEEAKRG